MRRKDREVTDPERIEQIIADSHCCRIGFNDDGEVYIVPLSFGYARGADDSYTFYFHGASQGRKIDLIHKNPRVGFELSSGPGRSALSRSRRKSAKDCCASCGITQGKMTGLSRRRCSRRSASSSW